MALPSGRLTGSDLQHQRPEQLCFLQLGSVCGVLEPDQFLAGGDQLVEVALGRFARGHPIEPPLAMTTGTPIAGSERTRSRLASSDSSASCVAETPRKVRTTSPSEAKEAGHQTPNDRTVGLLGRDASKGRSPPDSG